MMNPVGTRLTSSDTGFSPSFSSDQTNVAFAPGLAAGWMISGQMPFPQLISVVVIFCRSNAAGESRATSTVIGHRRFVLPL